ncbi:hypothetical protein GALMADRAFT_1362616 [Galerina marginata CBS 339.88]|uniref:Uncharacterized protein n=1 Tax=Galerina marginata (strain CBS 339.88) TaxID=685588 RepID=A0A067S4Q7_GALM3|nr:hypothetical protein GALMADRAFT_1362616 [Galerina marginata CBS 339.88]
MPALHPNCVDAPQPSSVSKHGRDFTITIVAVADEFSSQLSDTGPDPLPSVSYKASELTLTTEDAGMFESILNGDNERLKLPVFGLFSMERVSKASVWKTVFIHLMRVFYAAGNNCVQALNWRYRRVSTFGRNTIRRFSNNASAMKKLAARDFEDRLQAFTFPLSSSKGNLSLIEPLVLNLTSTSHLINFGWSQSRYKIARSSFTGLRQNVRSQYKTRALQSCSNTPTSQYGSKGETGCKPKASRKKSDVDSLLKLLYLFTYKLNVLGDYVAAILRFGPSDGFSTRTGELEHKKVKIFYARTNKGRTFERQISRHQRRERILRRIASRVKKGQDNFLPDLKDRLLSRLAGNTADSQEHSYSDDECDNVEFVLRVDYITYDVRRSQDSINPRTHSDVTTLSREDDPGILTSLFIRTRASCLSIVTCFGASSEAEWAARLQTSLAMARRTPVSQVFSRIDEEECLSFYSQNIRWSEVQRHIPQGTGDTREDGGDLGGLTAGARCDDEGDSRQYLHWQWHPQYGTRTASSMAMIRVLVCAYVSDCS